MIETREAGRVAMLRYTWSCSCCGRQFDELPLDWSAEPAPLPYYDVPEAERAARTTLSKSFCTVDRQAFVRGLVEIPVIGHPNRFAWGVWVSLSEKSAEMITALWDDPDQERAGPFFGWLCSRLPLYPDTLHLKTHVHLRAPPLVPYIEVEPTDHPLAVEQRAGMTVARVREIAEALLPRH